MSTITLIAFTVSLLVKTGHCWLGQFIGLVVGLSQNDIHLTMWICLAGTAITLLAVVPPWPSFNKNPQSWVGSRTKVVHGNIVVQGIKVQWKVWIEVLLHSRIWYEWCSLDLLGYISHSVSLLISAVTTSRLPMYVFNTQRSSWLQLPIASLQHCFMLIVIHDERS